MIEEKLPFIIFSAMSVLLVGFSLIVVTARSVFRSAIALTAALGVVAGLFALMGADFVAASQLLIYVGGIMIIMLFVIMLSQRPQGDMDRQTNDQWLLAGVFALAVAFGILMPLKKAYLGVASSTIPEATTAMIGRLLLGPMVVPFEAVSLVLLAALLGAVYFGMDKEKS